MAKTPVFAESTTPPYLYVTTPTGAYSDQDTVFLDENEKLSVVLGKPQCDTTNIENGTNMTINQQSDIGDYALAKLETSFSLKINNLPVQTQSLKDGGFVKFISYYYQPVSIDPNTGDTVPTGDEQTFMYFTMQIDLTKDVFPSGEYTISFTDYVVYSQNGFTYVENQSFELTLFIFQTTEYFSSNDAVSQNTNFNNVELATPNTTSYRNYYYFNFSNLYSNAYNQTQNFLPALTYDASKFILNISKIVAGNKYTCEINKFNTNLVTLGQTTHSNFVDATYNESYNEITVVFNDLGEYVLEYTFIFERYNHEIAYLQSNEIAAVGEKNDVLYVYGMQMYHSGLVSTDTEFKALNQEKTSTLPNKSADITYLIPSQNSNLIKSKSPSTDFETDDATIKTLIQTHGLTPVSTNQPAIITNTNATLNTTLSQYYTGTPNIETGEYSWSAPQKFLNAPFTESGTYLVKVVYNYDYYYSSTTLSQDTQFVQYFFFTIDNSIPSVTITDSLGKNILNGSFTKNQTTISLGSQSIFNSPVNVEIYTKGFTNQNYILINTLVGSDEVVSTTVQTEGNYLAKLVYGKNQNKSKYTYFTIDTTDLTGIKILPASKNTITNSYEKDTQNIVDFFTSETVVVEWNEKASGAQTKAYYKYIPFSASNAAVTDYLNYAASGITTTYMLNFDPGKIYDKASYDNAKHKINGSNIFTNQGLYIIQIIDEAGHEKFVYFCIDRSPIQVLQMSDNGDQKFVGTYDLISDNQTLAWGNYKLISMNCDTEDIEFIADPWVKSVITTYYTEVGNAPLEDNIHSISSKLYFSVEICKVYGLQTGTDLKLVTNSTTNTSQIKILSETSDGMKYANEITYSYFFIDEANKTFNTNKNLYGGTASLAQAQNFALNADKSFQITTSTDASNAQILINNTQGLNDVSLLEGDCVSLLQAGFSDSNTTTSTEPANLRSKYYFATGSTFTGNVSILSYKLKLSINSNLNVSKITMYYYPFLTDSLTKSKVLSTTASKTIIYDATSPLTSALIALGGAASGYYAFNINMDYDNSLNSYLTLPGKYVIQRDYDNENFIDEYDYSIRESVFIVDREDIVSTPEQFGDSALSTVGGGIFVNVLDGHENAVQFQNIYAAKNNTNTYILQTNKLPVVVYVPIAKYGQYSKDDQNTFMFVQNQILSQYMQTDGDRLIRYTYINDSNNLTEEKSYLKLVYFGDVVLTENFERNNNSYKSTDFELSVSITSSSGQTIECSANNLGYIVSENILGTGIYYVTITQNHLNGLIYPNAYKTFKFSFQIIDAPPSFVYTSETDTENANPFDTDPYGVYYTNESNRIKVYWTDPTDTTYYAKVDTTADVNGYTKISYHFTNQSGQNISAVSYLQSSQIQTDLSNTNLKYFYIDITSIPNNAILNVYMKYERGNVSAENYALLERLTAVTQKLYIDRTAPTEVLNQLIAKTTINDISFASYTRKYINFDGSDATNNSQLYNVPITSGALAKYAFAVQNTQSAPLLEMFSPKTPNGTYYTEGYYYHIEQILDIADYSLPNLSSAISTAKTYQNQVVQSFSYNTYYEITEIDLAGNVAIYLIFVTDNDNKNVLQIEREQTDLENKNYINYDEVSLSQDIYAKSFLKITNISMHNYAFMEFSLDGEIYFLSSALSPGQCYSFSSMTTQNTVPEIITISSLLSFTAPSAHTLIINDSIKGYNYVFNLYITDSQLKYNLLNSGEGIQIQGANQNGYIKQFLSSITISSYDKNQDKYITIYQNANTFGSNSFVAVETNNDTYTFRIIAPDLAYSYVFYDNYGIQYIEHHTAGSFVLNENDKVKNHIDEVLISEMIDGKQSTNNWYVSKNNVIYNYSSTDYYAYIKIYMLSITDEKISWETLTQAQSQYGTAISDQSNYSITNGSNILCTISTSTIHPTVKQLLLYAPTQNAFSTDFTGGVYKIEITLLDQYDSSNTNTITDRILINNLTPIIDLKDKNYQSVYEDDSIYSEQLTIVVPSLPSSLTSSAIFSNFMFVYSSELVFNQTTALLSSGTIVEDPGTYEIRVYIKVGNNFYLTTSKSFIISESSSAFYEVLVRDSHTGTYVKASTTGNEFTYNNIVCYNHFIVNDEFELFLNKNQYMEKKSETIIDNHECITYIYQLSNFNYTSSNNISPYQTTIAISYIQQTSSIITNNLFTYETNDGSNKTLLGTNTYIAITQSDTDVDHITINFNNYYAIPENIITATITSENQVWQVNKTNSTSSMQTTSFKLSSSGDYTISFTDLAGNTQLFSDSNGIEQTYYYKIRFIKGVAYLINGETPIQNAIYNDIVTITLPQALSGVYDTGGKPTIVVLKNNQEITVKPVNNEYILDQTGYYKVYFNARVKDKELRQEYYEFLIMSSKEYKSNFEFTEYGDYEIISVQKDGKDFTSSIRKIYNLSQNDSLKNIAISLYDEKTGAGSYNITIATNSGVLYENSAGELVPESFDFDFLIKAVGIIPITVSINEGDSTTNEILVEFNAFDLYQEIGECIIVYGKNSIKINDEYLNSLTDGYFCSLPITETGTHFVQVYNSSDTLLYSYKVVKTEPLNTVSIILIVAGVLAAAGLTVTIVLLRKRMKIR